MMRGGRGFTFIELIVVVAIIAILAAILFPVFARAREKARQARCLSNMGQIALAMSIYARDHAGHLPPGDDDLTPLLGRYLPMAEVLACPSSGRPPPPDAVRRAGAAVGVPLAHASVLGWGYEGDTSDSDRGPLPPYDYFYRAGFCDDEEPNTLLLCDSDLARHNGGANCLFADGHAKWLNERGSIDDWKPGEYPLDVIAAERGLSSGRLDAPMGAAPPGAPGMPTEGPPQP